MGLPQSSYDTTKTRVHVIRVEIEAGWMSCGTRDCRVRGAD